MKLYYETNLLDFKAWSGGADTLAELTYEQTKQLDAALEEMFSDYDEVDETSLNDFLWFERDAVAELLGFTDWECLVRYNRYGDEVKVKITNIEWDIDDEEDVPDLPTTAENEFDYDGDNDALIEEISSWLSDEYEYSVNGFDFEIDE